MAALGVGCQRCVVGELSSTREVRVVMVLASGGCHGDKGGVARGVNVKVVTISGIFCNRGARLWRGRGVRLLPAGRDASCLRQFAGCRERRAKILPIMKIPTLIADDEPRLAEDLREQLRIAWPRIEVIALAHDGAEAMRALGELKPRLAFLDICMPGMDGVNVAWHAGGECKVVFVSAWKDYAVDAFAQGAVDYLLKPVTERRLAVTLRRLREHFPERAGAEGAFPAGCDATGARMGGSSAKPAWIVMKTGSETRAIHSGDVLYFEATGNYVRVVGADASGMVRQTLRGILGETPPGMFLQIHRGIAVNASMIKSVRRTSDGASLAIKGSDDVLMVSRNFAGQFFGNVEK